MHVQPAHWLKSHPDSETACQIIRACVHCGFCNAICPTYQLLGDELDGPRGRIYQIQSLLEGQPPTARIQTHLDRCLTCRACESVCPSGVRYGRLLDIGRAIVEPQRTLGFKQRLLRLGLRKLVPYPKRLAPWVRLAKIARPLLPVGLAARLPSRKAPAWPMANHPRRMVVLEGCVQRVLAPQISACAARVLDRLGISPVRAPEVYCCGALSYHLGAQAEGLDFARRGIDALWPYLERGVEAIVSTASGCGLMIKEYGELLAKDPQYASKAKAISAKTLDISQAVAQALDLTPVQPKPLKVACHIPCTLQHGLRLGGLVESILTRLGFVLTEVGDLPACCGSAGAYSLLQPELASRLRQAKVAALTGGQPEVIATANLGCLLYLREVVSPVVHWIELLADG